MDWIGPYSKRTTQQIFDVIADLEVGEKQINGRLDAAFEVLAGLVERVQALEKAPEPKPQPPDGSTRLYPTATEYAHQVVKRIEEPTKVDLWSEVSKAFYAGFEFARLERDPQTCGDDEKILTEPLNGCPCCNHTPEERRAYRMGYYAGSIGQEPDTCPHLDHAPFANPWMEGFDKGHAEWELLNPEPDESEDEPCQP